MFSVVAFVYVLASFAVSTFNNTNGLDFVQAYKAFIYIPIISAFVGKSGELDAKFISRIFWILAFFFLIKYGYSRALDLNYRMGRRPGVLDENNFELILLNFIFYITHSRRRIGANLLATAILIAVVGLSGSRSGAIGAAIALAMMALERPRERVVVLSFIIPVGFLAGMLIISERSIASLEEIDRFRFLTIFLREVSDWTPLGFIFGARPLTPLSPDSCNQLAFYSGLFSRSGDGTCYSVILHSYALRVIFDHGVFGVVILIGHLYFAYRSSAATRRQMICLCLITTTSALSISAFNSIYYAISAAVLLSSSRNLSRVSS